MNETIVIVGVLLSILFYEVSELSPGGLIVPGYFALFSNDYKRIVATILVAFFVLIAVGWCDPSNENVIYISNIDLSQ